ncbi:MAG: sulfite exporter TauE/SafE family protein [Spirochaetales bacterium]|nr:sulfite exporter TauE/SafE family protein [Spirochaetales bacterium]
METTALSGKKRILGWEIAHNLETEKPEIQDRMSLGKKELIAISRILALFLLFFSLAYWLAGNPLKGTTRIDSPAVTALGEQRVFIWVILLAVLFEFLDSSAGMGYGTALTPMLLLLGFHPMQIVPAIMIQQCIAGFSAAYMHKEFSNVEWKLKPMSETLRVALFLTITGSAATLLSTTAFYSVFKVSEEFIKIYVSILLILMGAVSMIHNRGSRPYRPGRILFFGTLAGFNKGVGGGGYGPVVTVGGILSGIPVKTMTAITSLAEGIVCLSSLILWFILMTTGRVELDFILLPSMIIGSFAAVIAAPYMVKILPSRLWSRVVPLYCITLALYLLIKVIL